jgi:hypothetical protein
MLWEYYETVNLCVIDTMIGNSYIYLINGTV